MGFEDFLTLIAPPQRDAAHRLYEALAAAHNPVDPDLFVARLRDQGLVDEATVRDYLPDETIELTVIRPCQPAASDDTTVVLEQAAGRGERPGVPPANPSPGQPPVQGFGIDIAPADPIRSRYHLLGRLSAGAMGQIHLAKDRGLRRKVAYKQLLQEVDTIPGLTQRFLLEAQVMAQLDHPNVVPVYTLEQVTADRFAYAMKLVRGQTLASLLQEAFRCVAQRRALPMALSRATLLDHFLKVCDAVAYAHAKGVLHRDLKPANIMIGPFHEVYVMDWGLARVCHAPEEINDTALGEPLSLRDDDPAATHTRLGQVMGTPSYMSPEQASGDNANLDPRSDLYALGLILFELVSLRRALHGPSVDAVLQMAQRGDKQPLISPAPHLKIPRELGAIIAKATAIHPQERYQTVTALADDLRHFLRDEPVVALPDTPLRRLLRWIGRHRQATLQILMGALLAVLSVIGWNFYQQARALVELQAHKERLSHYLTSVSEQSSDMDRQFLLFEGLLGNLASAVTQARLHGAASKEPLYLPQDYRMPHRAPRDLAAASRYRNRPISTDHPVYVMAPGVSAAHPGLRETMQRLAPLRDPLQRLFLFNTDQPNAQTASTEAHQIIGTQERPLKWAYFALREGLMVVYPGQNAADLPSDYDPRQHPWYRDAVRNNGKFWSNPYQDQLGQGLLLSCSMPLFDQAGQLLGAAGIDISLDYVIERFMQLPGQQRVRESFLLDQHGRIVVRSSDQQRDPSQIEARSTDQPELYPYPEIVAEIQASHTGYREIRQNDQAVWIVYDDIETLGWAYVVEFLPEIE